MIIVFKQIETMFSSNSKKEEVNLKWRCIQEKKQNKNSRLALSMSFRYTMQLVVTLVSDYTTRSSKKEK